MDLAVPAFEDPPVGAGVAQVAMPLNQRAIRLDHLEDMSTRVRERHLSCFFFAFLFLAEGMDVCEICGPRLDGNSLAPGGETSSKVVDKPRPSMPSVLVHLKDHT